MGIQSTKKEVSKILGKIQGIAKMGSAGYRDFEAYIREIIINKKADFMYQCAEIFYDINQKSFNNLAQFKNALWAAAVSDAKLPFLEGLERILTKKGVYLIGQEIRDLSGKDYTFELSPTLDENLQVVATASKVGFHIADDKILIDLLDPNICEIKISNVDWATYSTTPKNLSLLQTISSGLYYDTLTFTGSLNSTQITDLVAVTNSTSVSGTLQGINRIDLSVNIEHTFVGDLQINLKGPSGKVINAKKQGGKLDYGNNMNVTFTSLDNYDRLMRTTKDNTTGTYRMDKFAGIGDDEYIADTYEIRKLLDSGSIVGDWTMYLRDVGIGGSGKLLAWKLQIGASRMNDYCTQSQYVTEMPTTQGGVYHVEVTKRNPYGKFIYRMSASKDDLLGTVSEVDFTSTVDRNYYSRSKRVMEVLGIKKYYLEVRANNSDQVVTMMSETPNLSEQGNLLERYAQAVDYLKNQSYINQVVDVLSIVDYYPEKPSIHDRYLNSEDGIIEWSGDKWEYPPQYVGMRLKVKETGKILRFDGINWVV